MAFEEILSSEIEVGDAIKKELFDKIKNSLDDHELRLNAAEAGTGRVVVWDLTVLNAASSNTMTGLTYAEAFFPYTITGCEVRCFETGSLAGDLEIDVKKSTGGLNSGDFSSIFTTLPSIDFSTASDYDRSTNQAFNGSLTEMEEGDTLRLDVTSMPTGGILGKFRVILYGELS